MHGIFSVLAGLSSSPVIADFFLFSDAVVADVWFLGLFSAQQLVIAVSINYCCLVLSLLFRLLALCSELVILFGNIASHSLLLDAFTIFLVSLCQSCIISIVVFGFYCQLCITAFCIHLGLLVSLASLVSHEVQHFCADHGIHLVPFLAYYRHALAERFLDTWFCMIRSLVQRRLRIIP